MGSNKPLSLCHRFESSGCHITHPSLSHPGRLVRLLGTIVGIPPLSQKLPINPRHSTTRCQTIHPEALHCMTRRRVVRSAGCNWSFYPGGTPPFAPDLTNNLPRRIRWDAIKATTLPRKPRYNPSNLSHPTPIHYLHRLAGHGHRRVRQVRRVISQFLSRGTPIFTPGLENDWPGIFEGVL